MVGANDRPVALVSGGSRGIGRAVAKRLAADGYDLSFCYHSHADAALECAAALEELGRKALPVQVDVEDAAAVRSWVSETEERLGSIDVVVTSAGVVRDSTLLRMSESAWRTVLGTDLDGIFNVCKAVLPHFMERRRGSIVNISSLAGIQGNPGQTNYSAAKAGVIGMTMALAKEVGVFGIRVNAVAPGFVETEMTAELADETLRRVADRAALRRLGTTDEIANAVAFLASDQASYVTACVLRIDGGLSL